MGLCIIVKMVMMIWRRWRDRSGAEYVEADALRIYSFKLFLLDDSSSLFL